MNDNNPRDAKHGAELEPRASGTRIGATRLREWLLFDAPYGLLFRFLARPHLWLQRRQLEAIAEGSVNSTSPLPLHTHDDSRSPPFQP